MLKDQILTELRRRKEFCSGQALCETFQVTRTAVWKAIQGLKEEGYKIEARQNRGYLLHSDRDALNEKELKAALRETAFFRDILYFQEIDSTNKEAKRRAEQGETGDLLLVADRQSDGRGRKGRSWSSPSGTGIWMSMLLHPAVRPEHASMITLITALAVADGICRVTGLDVGIKWPNDLVLSGKKICGILTEMNTDLEEIAYVVPGIGINVNTESFPEDIGDVATSLKRELGRTVDRLPLIAAIVEELIQALTLFQQTENLEQWKARYEARLVNLGRAVRVLDPRGEFSGIAEGINEQGELNVQREDGTFVCVRSGEVSVRGIYGYV